MIRLPLAAMLTTTLMTTSAFGQVPTVYHDGGNWKVTRASALDFLPVCFMRSHLHTIDKLGDPKWGYTYLELDKPTGPVTFSGEGLGAYFRNTRSVIQIDGGPAFEVHFREIIQEPSLIDRMKAGRAAVIVVSDLSGTGSFEHTFSLSGFTRALGALKACQDAVR